MELEIKPPTPDSPGFLYRTKRALLLQRALAEPQMSAEAIDQIVEFLAPFVVKPEGEKDKREALLMASQTQFMELFNAVAGAGTEASDPK
jgi:hypothetical protein